MQLTHRQLEIFQSLMQTLNVTETAKQLNSSQPTISRELKALEADLGFTLFQREKRRLEMTPQAVALNVIVQRSFVSLAEIARTARAIRGERLQRVTVACLPAFAHALMPQVVHNFRSIYPDASLKIHSLEETALTRDLLSKFFDLGVVEGNVAGNTSSIINLYAGDLLCIMPRNHTLAQHDVLEMAHFDRHDLIYYSEEDSYRRQIDAQFDAAGIARNLVVETTMVAAGIGVSIINPLSALAFESAGVVLRPLAQPIPYYLNIWQPDPLRRSQLGERFIETIVNTMNSTVDALIARNLCAPRSN